MVSHEYLITQRSHHTESPSLCLPQHRNARNTHLLAITYILWPQIMKHSNELLFLVTAQLDPAKNLTNYNEKQVTELDKSVIPKRSTGLSVLRGSYTLIKSYLEYFFIQQPCPKHSDTLCADHSTVPARQIQGLNPLTVQVEGHRLLVHTVGYPVPPERTKTESTFAYN